MAAPSVAAFEAAYPAFASLNDSILANALASAANALSSASYGSDHANAVAAATAVALAEQGTPRTFSPKEIRAYKAVLQAYARARTVVEDPSEIDARVAAAETAITALETSVDTATTGLLDRVDALETTVDTATTGLVDVVADHETRIVALEP